MACAVGGFDITQPLIKVKPGAPKEHIERISWTAYDDNNVENLLKASNECLFLYFKTSLSCQECDTVDETLQDNMIAYLLNSYFVNYKITNHDPDWEMALTRFDVNNIPTIIILSTKPYEIIIKHHGHLNINGLENTIMDALGRRCYD